MTDGEFSKLGFIKGKITTIGIIGIKQSAGEALYRFTDLIFGSSTRYQRGTTFNNILNEVTTIIMEEFLDRSAESVAQADVSTIEKKIEAWFQTHVKSHCLYIPCAISRLPANPFRIGPISFTYFHDFIAQERKAHENLFDITFGKLLESMGKEGVLWVAKVEVADCGKGRAWEVGSLAVDIVLAGLQLVIPLHFSERMARMTARRSPHYRETVSVSNGQVTSGGSNEEPGLGMGPGLLESYLDNGAAVLSSVGNRVAGFLSGSSATPNLNQEWCDAAYWFHEGLAEPLDTIAVPKLETAVEVLLRSESSSGSEKRLLKGIEVFYGLNGNQAINPDSKMTVKHFVKGFVRDRSRILHGTWSTLTHHLQDSRPSLTLLVQGLLAQFTLGLDSFMSDPTASDRIENFLQWLDVRRQTMSP